MKELKDLLRQQAVQQFLEKTIQAGKQQQDLLLVKIALLKQTGLRQGNKVLLLLERQAQTTILETEAEEDNFKLSFGWLETLLKMETFEKGFLYLKPSFSNITFINPLISSEIFPLKTNRK